MNTSEDVDIPPGIGPHEGHELELMLLGEKPAAMFNDDWPEGWELPEVKFAPYVDNGHLIKRENVIHYKKLEDAELRYYYYALPGEEWRINRLIEIAQSLFEQGVKTTSAIETEIGLLLGYQDADIKVYIDRFFGVED